MSGIYTPNVEKPNSCADCNAYTCPYNYEDCPIIPVPDHGRLI